MRPARSSSMRRMRTSRAPRPVARTISSASIGWGPRTASKRSRSTERRLGGEAARLADQLLEPVVLRRIDGVDTARKDRDRAGIEARLVRGRVDAASNARDDREAGAA